MSLLSALKPAYGSKHKRKVVGRGGVHGRSSTRGGKGQTARSGDSSMNGFAGGQTPLARSIPKRGFNNIFRKEYSPVNVGELENLFDNGATVTTDELKKKGAVKRNLPVKILGGGELKKQLKVKADGFSKSAAEKIKAAGGEAIVKG